MTTTEAALRDALKDIAKGVYIDAASRTHYSWIDGTNGREPDFGEAASDYAESFADAYVEHIAALSQPSPAITAWTIEQARELDAALIQTARNLAGACGATQSEMREARAEFLRDWLNKNISQPSLAQEAVTLVIAARAAWEEMQDLAVSRLNMDNLDRALEAFSSRVPYENEPDRAALSPSSGEPASVAVARCMNIVHNHYEVGRDVLVAMLKGGVA